MTKIDELIMARNRLECGNTAHSRRAPYIRLAIECIERQIPKNIEEDGICPNCGEELQTYIEYDGCREEYHPKYCDQCGQALSFEGWEEDDE